MFAYDPHLNLTVNIRNLTINGTTQTFYNPYNFTLEPFFLSLAPFNSGLAQFQPGDQLFAFQYGVPCVLPVSGVYCLMNRYLLLVEILFGLVMLCLSYEWLSILSFAAALNYTAVAAIHAILLVVAARRKPLYYPYDYDVLGEILVASVLLAHPMQQWSQILQKRVFARTRFIVACWCILICVAYVLLSYTVPNADAEVPVTEIDIKKRLPLEFGLTLNDLLCNNCFNDTINSFPLLSTPETWKNLQEKVIPCPNPDLSMMPPGNRDSSLVPYPFVMDALQINRHFVEVSIAFSTYSIIASAATVALAFHGQRGTHFVRAKIYLWVRGNRATRWRAIAAVAIALPYHTIQFVLGIASLPIAIVSIAIDEYTNLGIPQSEQPGDLGQWGPWIGALFVCCVIILNTGSAADILRSTLAWMLLTPAHLCFPRKFRRRHLPKLSISRIPLHRIQGGPRWLALFFIDEYLSTREWLRSPYQASLNCIAEEEASAADEDQSNRKSLLSKPGV